MFKGWWVPTTQSRSKTLMNLISEFAKGKLQQISQPSRQQPMVCSNRHQQGQHKEERAYCRDFNLRLT